MEDIRVKWRTLSADEIIVLASCVMLIPYYALVMKRIEVSELLMPKPTKTSFATANPSAAKARRLGIIVNKVTTIFSGDGTCLLRSLILRHLLSRRGTSGIIRLGVLPEQANFAAHAWVEVDGMPVNDTVDVAERYLPFGDPHLPAEFKIS